MIRSIFAQVDESDKVALIKALSEQRTYLAKLPGGRFLGVYVMPSDTLTIIHQEWPWAFGQLHANTSATTADSNGSSP